MIKTTRFVAAPIRLAVALAALATATTGCSIRSLATRALADSLSGSGATFASDDDMRLVEHAVPFALKVMEQVLGDQPRHVGLLAALASGFTQYAYAYALQEADVLEERDVAASRLARQRTRRLFLRAQRYGMRGLEVRHPGARDALLDPSPARWSAVLARCQAKDVPLLYWTAASWALAVGSAKDDLALVGQLPVVEAMMARALVLDERFDEGALHEFYVAYYGGRSEGEGGGVAKAREHLERARALSHNKKLGALVSYAESVSVTTQSRAEFHRLLEEVVAADVDRDPPHRLANLVAQQRARWLLGREAELFAD